MTFKRGDIVLVDYPFAAGTVSKIRPAVVVQNDRDNERLSNTVVVMITGRTDRAHEPTQFMIDVETSEGKRSGLVVNSIVNCINLFTMNQDKILRTLGVLAPALMKRLDACLKHALALGMKNKS